MQAKEIVLHPIDTIRARQQAEAMPGNNKTYSITSLYDGVIPALVGGIPSGALFFGIKDACSSVFRANGVSKEVSSILSVCITNIPYWGIRVPFEVLKTRQQTGSHAYATVEQLQGLLKREGLNKVLTEVYSSYLPNLLYALPAGKWLNNFSRKK